MSEQPYEPAPSEVIGPDTLDQALLVVVLRPDAVGHTFLSSVANREAVAGWLRGVADAIESSPLDCVACREGHDHVHDPA